MKACFLFFIIFISAFIGVRHLFPAGILFYQGVTLGLVISALHLAFSLTREAISVSEAVKSSALTFLSIYAFVFTVPTTVDRSYTVKMLIAMSGADDGFTRSQINDLYVDYFVRSGGVDKRLREQQESGTIVEREGLFHVTSRGRVLEEAFQFAQKLFVCE